MVSNSTPSKIKIQINGKSYLANTSQTILDVAKKHNIVIPTLCYHPDLTPNHQCGMCVVELVGQDDLVTACSTLVTDGMKIITNSEKVIAQRKINARAIADLQCGEDDLCVSSQACQLDKISREHEVEIKHQACPVNQEKDFGPAIEYNRAKCIGCMNCVEACNKFSCGYLEIEKLPNGQIKSKPSEKPDKDCIYCGQCVVHCPVGALREVSDIDKVSAALNNQSKTVVFQFAPSIRVSIGEEFGMSKGEVVTDQLAQAIRELGADFVFDVSVGADFTTNEEAKELLEKISSQECKLLLSSCCPSWVKFVEFYYPEFIKNLASTRSPQMILAGLIKKNWTRKQNLDSKKIVLVSVMPCTSKKYEIERPENQVDGEQMIDYVITTRELAKMLKAKKIDLKQVAAKPADNPLGDPSGAGVIYGASGGVMESALRTAYCKVTNKCLPDLAFKEIRGQQGVKTAEVDFAGKKVRVAVVNGIPNAKKILDELKENPGAYSCVEVMACPGGCIGGGGQPIPVSEEVRQARADALYSIDKLKTIHYAHENPILQQTYREFLTDESIIKKICHTTYSKKGKEVT